MSAPPKAPKGWYARPNSGLVFVYNPSDVAIASASWDGRWASGVKYVDRVNASDKKIVDAVVRTLSAFQAAEWSKKESVS